MTSIELQMLALEQVRLSARAAELAQHATRLHAQLCDSGEWEEADAKVFEATAWFEAHLMARQRSARLIQQAAALACQERRR